MTTPNALQVLPYLDSPELAAARRQELDLPRHLAAALGRSAVDAAREGSYATREGVRVIWRDAVQAACDAKESIPPETSLPDIAPGPILQTSVHVTNETTFGAARRLVAKGGRPLALNFANGIHPGGGFLSGSRAQEEVLCRSSALHATLVGDPMYAAHAGRDLPDSTDWAIHSPDVPVFRRDDGTELPEPWLLSMLTCAAPYAPRVGQPRSRELLRQRIHRVLAIARSGGYRELVLGAWGCGAFGNDPRHTAQDFRRALETQYAGAFETVVFAVTDWSKERRFLGPFRDVFVAGAEPHDE
jgi:uncharacterized protein (TIGR02452 family)